MKRRFRQTIAGKLTLAFCVMALVQSILMAGILVGGGVIRQTRNNVYRIFEEKVENRRSNLENEMRYVWTDIGHYADQIRQHASDLSIKGSLGQGSGELLLRTVAPVMQDALNSARTTGVFLILQEAEGEDSHEALYLRNSNPTRNGSEGAGLYLMAGPWSVADDLDIVTDINWSLRLNLDDTNRNFYQKPFENAGLSDNTQLLGYWSPPFSLFPGDSEIITYSYPLSDDMGNLIGVFGVEISLNYLYKHLPYTDMQARDAYGYVIGYQPDEKSEIYVAAAYGALQRRLFEKCDMMQLEPVKGEDTIFKLKQKGVKRDIYVCTRQLGLYYNNTPFSDERWYLMGVVDKKELLYLPKKIDHIILGTLVVSLCAGIVFSFLFGQSFTRFSRLIELSEVPVGAFELSKKKRGVFMTSQIAMLLQLDREQERLFSKNKERFLEYLNEVCTHKTNEVNVYAMNRGQEVCWVRITWKEKDGITRGVIEDVTEEIIEKRALMLERDYDELTGVKNRKAFTRTLEQWNGDLLLKYSQTAMVMCDLNGLKKVNDASGHDKGDDYIRYSSEAICAAFPDGQVFRIGGDEFAVILMGTSVETIRECEARLHERMAEYDAGSGFDTGIAVGYALYDDEQDQNLEQVLIRADSWMYKHKRKGQRQGNSS